MALYLIQKQKHITLLPDELVSPMTHPRKKLYTKVRSFYRKSQESLYTDFTYQAENNKWEFDEQKKCISNVDQKYVNTYSQKKEKQID